MKRIFSAIALSLLLVAAGTVTADAGAVRISQVYVGGGVDDDPVSSYRSDYVELFNASGAPVNIGGWLLAYDTYIFGQPNTPQFACAGCSVTLPSNTSIGPCGYFLIQCGPVGTQGGAALPTPDLVLPDLNLVYGNFEGTIALMSSGAPDHVNCPSTSSVEDLVGWGAGCRCFLIKSVGAPLDQGAAFRLVGGMTDTRNNAADFAVFAPAPRNSAAPANAICLQTPALSGSWGKVKAVYR